MPLSNDIISQFAKVTNDGRNQKNEVTVYGTIHSDGNTDYVMIDGSEELTPVVSTVDVSQDDRVLVKVINHSATVTGNTTDPSIGTKRANGLESTISQTAEEIRLEVKNEVAGLESSISVTAEQIRLEVSNEVAGLESSITQTAKEIRAEVKDSLGNYSTISQTKDLIKTEVASEMGEYTTIEQTKDYIKTEVANELGDYSEFKQTVEGFAFMNKGGTVKISSGSINLTGAITWSHLSSGVKTEITDAQDAAASAQDTADDAWAQSQTNLSNINDLDEAVAWLEENGAGSSAELPDYLHSTYIDSTKIVSPNIVGGYFASVSEDSWVEMTSNGLYMYVNDLETPKFCVVNEDTYIYMRLGAGDSQGYDVLELIKWEEEAELAFLGHNGTSGFHFMPDGTIDVIGVLNY